MVSTMAKMAKMATSEEEAGKLICSATCKIVVGLIIYFPVSSGLGSFSARIMFLPGMVQSIFD